MATILYYALKAPTLNAAPPDVSNQLAQMACSANAYLWGDAQFQQPPFLAENPFENLLNYFSLLRQDWIHWDRLPARRKLSAWPGQCSAFAPQTTTRLWFGRETLHGAQFAHPFQLIIATQKVDCLITLSYSALLCFTVLYSALLCFTLIVLLFTLLLCFTLFQFVLLFLALCHSHFLESGLRRSKSWFCNRCDCFLL
jgi:hypothetical protein